MASMQHKNIWTHNPFNIARTSNLATHRCRLQIVILGTAKLKPAILMTLELPKIS